MWKVLSLDYVDWLKIKKYSDLKGIPMKHYVKSLLPQDNELDKKYDNHNYMNTATNHRLTIEFTRDNWLWINDINNQIRYLMINKLIEEDRNKRMNDICKLPKQLKIRSAPNNSKKYGRGILLTDDNYNWLQVMRADGYFISPYINYIIERNREDKQNGN